MPEAVIVATARSPSLGNLKARLGLLASRFGASHPLKACPECMREDFEVHAISMDAYTPDGVQRLAEKGVTDCIVGFRVPYIKGPDTEPLEDKVKHLERYAEQVIAKVNR